MGKLVKAKVTETHVTAIVGDLEENRILHTTVAVTGKVKGEKKIEKIGKNAAENMGLAFIKIAGVDYIKVSYVMPIEKFVENAEVEEVLD